MTEQAPQCPDCGKRQWPVIHSCRMPSPAERYADAVRAAQDAYDAYRQRVLLGMAESWEGQITVLPEGYASQLTID